MVGIVGSLGAPLAELEVLELPQPARMSSPRQKRLDAVARIRGEVRIGKLP